MSGEMRWRGWGTVAFCAGTMLALTRPVGAVGWRPVTPQELALAAPKVEAGADAEALFHEIDVYDTFDGGLMSLRSVQRHYVRVKIFTEAGKQSQGHAEITYSGGSIVDVAGRTIKPDGTVLELGKSEVFDREVERGRNKKTKRMTTFALPGVEPGSIIEYRWTYQSVDRLAGGGLLPLQRSVPTQHLRLAVRPMPSERFRMRLQSFGVALSPITTEARGEGLYNVTTAENIPAFKKEPDMPPENDVRAWVLIRYTDRNETPAEYWRGIAHFLGKDEYQFRSSGSLRAALPAILGDAAAPAERVARICEFCRTQIKRIDDDISGLTADERRQLKDNKTASDVLERRYGTEGDIRELFGALAVTAGLDARPAFAADRSDAFFKPQFLTTRFLDDSLVAVALEGGWRFYDPGERYVPCGGLRWQNEAVAAMIVDGKDGAFANTPLTPADQSQIKRNATLRLAADGTLEGDVSVTFAGHPDNEAKEEYDAETVQRREELERDALKARLSLAELSSAEFQNATDPIAPLAIRYHVRVPAYAQRTGKRLFLQPSFFQYGVPARYTSTERRYDIYYSYPWSELDTVDIELPAGYELERAESPGPVRAGSVIECAVTMSVKSEASSVLHLERRFRLGSDGTLVLERQNYPALRQFFEALKELDGHVLTLRQTGGAQ
jgi:hypothetical protein